MERNRTALVLGATGGVGGAIAKALLAHGWDVRGMARSPALAGDLAGIEWIQGDAMKRNDVIDAAAGASVIVHAVNPPGYRDWDKLVLPMIDNSIAAARAAGGARIVLPGTIYNFDPGTTSLIGTDTPQRPNSRKGMIRVALEKRLEQAAPEVPTLILRAGDFFGPGARSSWFSQAMVTPGKLPRWIVNPARGGGHSWAYLPDLAEAFARLLRDGDRLARFERLQFRGYQDTDGRQMVNAIRRACGRDMPILPFPWWLVRLMAPLGGFPREALDIASHWRYPVALDNTRLVDVIGDEPHRPLDEAVVYSLIDMGCLADADASMRLGSLAVD